MKSSRNVEEYIRKAPKEIQPKLKELQSLIKNLVPGAEEKISYGMPYYGYRGRLFYFAYFKDHISVFVMHGVADDFADEVKDIRTGRATLRLPLDRKLPLALLKKLVKASVKKNEISFISKKRS